MGRYEINCDCFHCYFCVHSFSRRIMWLRVGRTNNDPSVVARHFIDSIHAIGGILLNF